jgi:tetratricopeptide (TPR) repeat protein
MGVLCERRQRLAEAMEHFAAAAKLDPEAVAPQQALLPLYLTLDRRADALALTRSILAKKPDDYHTWYLYAKQLKADGKNDEAVAALVQTFGLPALEKDPEAFVQVSMELARFYEDLLEFENAANTLERAVRRLEPEHADLKMAVLYAFWGRVSSKAGNYSTAAQAYRKAQAALPAEEFLAARRLDYELALAYYADGKPNEALCFLDQYLETLPPGIEAYEMKVQLLRKTGRDRDVVPALEKARARDPHNTALQILLARHYVEEQRPDAAERIYLALADESPAAPVYRGLFTLHRTQHRLAETLQLLDRTVTAATDAGDKSNDGAKNRARAMLAALREDPITASALVNAMDRARLKDLKPETRRALAAFAFRARQLAPAEDLYRSLLDEPSPTPATAIAYDGILRVLWSAGKHEAVIEVCHKGLANPGDINPLPFHGNLARALVVLGKTKDALAAADRAVELSDPGNRLAYRLLRVEVLTLARRYAEAESTCKALLDEVNGPADTRRVRYVLSNIYTTSRAYPKAEEQLRLILKDDPDDATANNDLGYILADQNKDLDEAERLIRKALAADERERQANAAEGEDDPANAAFVDSLGWVLFRKGRLDEARRELERAVALPDGAADPVVWDHLGDVYFRLGNSAAAREAFEKAQSLYENEKRRALDDQYKELKRKLRQLESAAKQRGILEYTLSIFDWVKR